MRQAAMLFQPFFEILMPMLTDLPIRIVCATRETRDRFYEKPLLGRTLSNYRFLQLLQTRLFFQNERGLSEVYNIAIRESEEDPSNLVFIHDDVCISDFYWPGHLHNALKHFGIAAWQETSGDFPGNRPGSSATISSPGMRARILAG